MAYELSYLGRIMLYMHARLSYNNVPAWIPACTCIWHACMIAPKTSFLVWGCLVTSVTIGGLEEAIRPNSRKK